jgi:hypothetical protein
MVGFAVQAVSDNSFEHDNLHDQAYPNLVVRPPIIHDPVCFKSSKQQLGKQGTVKLGVLFENRASHICTCKSAWVSVGSPM